MAKMKSTMVVKNLGDAVELINHNSDFFNRSIQKLTKSTRRLRLLSMIAVSCAVYTALECHKQEEELYKLSVRVKKLENKEGE